MPWPASWATTRSARSTSRRPCSIRAWCPRWPRRSPRRPCARASRARPCGSRPSPLGKRSARATMYGVCARAHSRDRARARRQERRVPSQLSVGRRPGRGREPGSDPLPPIRIAVLTPLAVGTSAVVCTILIHALAVMTAVNVVRRERRLGRVGSSFWIDLGIVVAAVSCALAAHLVEIALWALLFMICGEFSAVNYTTLGNDNVIMSPSWRLLGPLEAANGALMFGVSTALIFTVIQRMVQTRYVDLRE